MHSRALPLIFGALITCAGIHPAAAQAQAPQAALAGQVGSATEGAMEGVLVSAKRAGSTVTTTVVSDSKGNFSFPSSRLEPGRYTLTTRAVGYDLEGPKSADVAAGQTATADIKLRPTRNLPRQLSNAEWLASVPGTDNQKKGAAQLHQLSRSRSHREFFL